LVSLWRIKKSMRRFRERVRAEGREGDREGKEREGGREG
jgi:hypothetical protein